MEIPCLTAAPLAALSGVRHAFFTRAGGVSRGIYAALNCGVGSQDAAEAVSENRRRAAAALGCPGEALTTLYQVHSAEAVTLQAPLPAAERPEADALVTDRPGVLLGVLSADCAPVLFADGEAGVVAAAHAGWKGALSGVTDAALAAMERLGARRERVAAAVGPCIAQASYEVGPEFAATFRAAHADNERYFVAGRGDRLQFDLKGYLAGRLSAAGVGSVAVEPADTQADEARFFSYRRSVHRREGDYGRLLSAIVLEG